jgi:hypothetical protein
MIKSSRSADAQLHVGRRSTQLFYLLTISCGCRSAVRLMLGYASAAPPLALTLPSCGFPLLHLSCCCNSLFAAQLLLFGG